MSRSTRFLLNAALLLLIGGHAVYWLATGRAESESEMRVGLVIAQAVVGIGGAVWFYARSRGAAK